MGFDVFEISPKNRPLVTLFGCADVVHKATNHDPAACMGKCHRQQAGSYRGTGFGISGFGISGFVGACLQAIDVAIASRAGSYRGCR